MSDEVRIAVPTAWGISVVHATAEWMPTRIEVPTVDAVRRTTDRAPSEARGSAAAVCTEIQRYFAGQHVTWPNADQLREWLDAQGWRGFRLQALLALAAIPRGALISYGELAAQAGSPGAARAAGSACAQNPFPVLIPCHRVVPAHGGVGRYSAADGAPYKQRLWKLEAVPGRPPA